VENWFKQIPYARAVALCDEAAIRETIDIDIVSLGEADTSLLRKVMRITPDSILRHYREDHFLRLRWRETIDLAVQLQSSMVNISAKDWAIWGLPDGGEPPLTSEAGFVTWIDRGNLVVKLRVEQDSQFPFFMDRLKTRFPEFASYEQWRKSVTDFFQMCYALAQEIWGSAEKETELNLSSIPVMGKGHLLNVPKFIYEFALENYASAKQPHLDILQHDPYRYKLVPGDFPNYILAIGSRDEMEKCQKVTISLIKQYTKDQRMSKINAKALQLKQQIAPFQSALSAVIRAATGDI
jgi:hypothetical protein